MIAAIPVRPKLTTHRQICGDMLQFSPQKTKLADIEDHDFLNKRREPYRFCQRYDSSSSL